MTQADYDTQCKAKLNSFLCEFSSKTIESTLEIWNRFKEEKGISRDITTWRIDDKEYECFFKYEKIAIVLLQVSIISMLVKYLKLS